MSRSALGEDVLNGLLPPRRRREERQRSEPEPEGKTAREEQAGDGEPSRTAGAPDAAAEPADAKPKSSPGKAARSGTPASPPLRPRKQRRPASGQGPGQTEATPRKRISCDLPATVCEAARDVVYWTPGLTLAALVEAGLRAEIERREKQRGEPFPRRTGDLPPGPPAR